MKSIIAALVVIILLAGGTFLYARYNQNTYVTPVPPKAAPFPAGHEIVTDKTVAWTDMTKTCTIQIHYPELSGLSSTTVQIKVNDYIRTRFLKLQDNFQLTDDNGEATSTDFLATNNIGPGTSSCDYYSQMLSYEVKLNQNGLFSLRYDGVGGIGAHPIKDYNAVTFDMDTGSILTYKDILKEDATSTKKIKDLFHNNLTEQFKQYGEEEPPTEGDSSPDPFTLSATPFYLTEESIIFFNFYDMFALQSIEVPIPYSSIRTELKNKKILKMYHL